MFSGRERRRLSRRSFFILESRTIFLKSHRPSWVDRGSCWPTCCIYRLIVRKCCCKELMSQDFIPFLSKILNLSMNTSLCAWQRIREDPRRLRTIYCAVWDRDGTKNRNSLADGIFSKHCGFGSRTDRDYRKEAVRQWDIEHGISDRVHVGMGIIGDACEEDFPPSLTMEEIILKRCDDIRRELKIPVLPVCYNEGDHMQLRHWTHL
jgi:hypothetical protein